MTKKSLWKRWLGGLAGIGLLLAAAALLVPANVRNTVVQFVAGIYRQPLLSFGSFNLTIATVVEFTVFLTILLIGSRVVGRVLRRRVLVYLPIGAGPRYAISKGVEYLAFALGLVVSLHAIGLNLSSLAVLGGFVGIGVGLGLQNIANNFVSGLILLLERPIKVGDRVEVANLSGDVVKIESRATWVRTNDNVVIIIPNSEFVGQRVTNWTANDRQVRFSVPLGVSYGSDPEQIRELLLEVAQSDPDVLRNPVPDVLFVGFGDSSLDFELRVWTMSRVQTPHILKSNLYFALFEIFKKHDIEIPFPQRDLHVRSAPGLTRLPAAGGPADLSASAADGN